MKNRIDISNDSTRARYDTRKVLNRSSKPIPSEIIEEIEAGTITIERIKELATRYPIFIYHTCITIHGNFGTIERTRIGGYKNIHQNQNGSLEIRYNAIDRAKKIELYNTLRTIRAPWNERTDSTGTTFTLSETLKEETRTTQIEEFKVKAEAIKKTAIYGNVSLYTVNIWGMIVLYLELRADAIPTDQIETLALAMTGHTPETFRTAQEETAAAALILQQQEEEEKRNRQIKAEQKQQEIDIILAPFKEKIATLPLCTIITQGISIKALIKKDGTPGYIFYKTERGSFGRVKIYKGYNSEPQEPEQWEELRTAKPEEGTRMYIGSKTKLFKAIQTQAPAKQPTTPKEKNNAPQPTGIEIVDYSERAIAIFGDTRPIKEKLSAMGGKFNAYLKKDGIKTAGWIFSKTKRAELETILN